MDLVAFIHHTDPTKVRIREREVREGEVPLIELTMRHVVLLAGEDDQGDANAQDARNDIVDEKGDDTVAAGQAEEGDHPKKVKKKRRAADGAGGSGLPPKKLREDHGTSWDNGANVVGKSLAALQGLLDSSTLATKVGVTAVTTIPFVTSFMTPTPKREGRGKGWRFCYWAKSANPSCFREIIHVVSLCINCGCYHSVVVGITSALIHDSSIGQEKPSMIDHLAPPRFFSQLRAMDYEQLLVEFSIGVARQACFNAEIRMQLEHELIEAEDTEAIRLRGQIANVEAVKAARVNELNNVKAKNIAKVTQDLSDLQLSCDELSVKASSLEFKKDKLIDQVFVLETTCFGLRDEVAGYKLFKEQVEAVQAKQVKALNDCVAGIDVDLMNVALHMDEEFYPPAFFWGGGALCCAIDKGMQSGLVAGVDHGKAGRGLKEIIVYDPSSKANFVSTVNTFCDMDFPFLHNWNLKRCKYGSYYGPSPLGSIQDQVIIGETSSSFALDVAHVRIQRLKGDDAACHLSLTNAMVRLLEPLSTKSVIGEASTSGIPATAMTTALYHLCSSQHRPSRTIY
nr:hypothetical protein [Tanacetum cinerariifolium]